jgi:hypothetical protein
VAEDIVATGIGAGETASLMTLAFPAAVKRKPRPAPELEAPQTSPLVGKTRVGAKSQGTPGSDLYHRLAKSAAGGFGSDPNLVPLHCMIGSLCLKQRTCAPGGAGVLGNRRSQTLW